MPKVAEFSGIAVYIYFGDHPPPHFHVRFQGHKAAVEIGSCRVLAGKLPAPVLSKVVHWARERGASPRPLGRGTEQGVRP